MSTGTPTNEENAKIETQLLTVETKKKENGRSKSKHYTLFYAWHSICHNVLFHLKKIS